MANPREIHRRMRSVKNIQQITKAMKMVAAARLRRAQEKAASTRPFADKIEKLLLTVVSDKSVLSDVSEKDAPLLAQRSVRKTGFIVVAADKGLAGSYNSNLLKHAVAEIAETDNYHLITVGRKAKEFFQHRGYDVAKDIFGLSDKPNFEYAEQIAKAAVDAFKSGEVDEVKLISTRFKSALSYTPETQNLLPVLPPAAEGQGKGEAGAEAGEVLFESPAEGMLAQLLPYYVNTRIYAALMQSAASELGARMTAMSSATDNASDLLRSLELSYNKARQAGITREINEIVGGAEALQQS
jgi:F-type H+-transporting ATPase subunit gamma